jgi:uncharacterized RDD family membrane protein YckC
MLRTIVEFSSDMPYDAIEEDGEFVQMPGRTVAEAMAQMLEKLGCVVEPVESAGDHGWFFDFRRRSVRASCEVTVIDGVVAQFSGPTGHKLWVGAAGPADPDYVDILTSVGEAIDDDPRFRDLGWFSSEEVTGRQVGARTPTGPYDLTPCMRTFGSGESDGPACGPVLAAQPLGVPGVGDTALEGWTKAWPMRRLAARMFDHFVVVGGALVLAISCLRIPPPTPTTMSINYNGYILFLSIAVGGGLMNALLLPWISTTPGKWLCRVRVVRADDEPLSYGAALKREAEAIVTGCALFIPLLMPVTFALNFARLIYTGETGWDRRRGSVARQAPTSFVAVVGILFCLLSSFSMFMLLLETWSSHQTVG